MRSLSLFCGVLLGTAIWMSPSQSLAKDEGLITEGRLDAFGPGGKALGPCPLEQTDVSVDIAGFIARVTVRQQFGNPFADKIEAVYVFPLSQDAAVDRMTMTVGDRVIEGEIKERGEARRIYEQAKSEGKVASLLDQERPNIFTQSVANIEPGERVEITISYSETLDWEAGMYQFDFPMVVGPRYIPGGGSAPAPMTSGRPTRQVPDGDRITPPVAPEGTRAGHDISVAVNLDAGLPIRHVESKQHQVTIDYKGRDKHRAVVKLKQSDTIPNKDFVLQYQTASEEIEDALLAHTDDRGKFFTLVLQPPERVRREQVVPKELVFVIDKSGSMNGFPIETAKEAMRLSIEGLHPNDTFNLLTFAGGVGFCFDEPVPNTLENRRKALDYLSTLQGSGGTEMMKAINACLAGQDDPERVRVVCFMTDGYVGNDMAIIDAVRQNAGTARVFSFGIGSSVNRFLLDGMARAGRGEVHYILNQEQAVGTAERFYERVRTPVLTDIELDFGRLDVEEVYPKQIPDLFSAKPVVVKGRYRRGGSSTITLSGNSGTGSFKRRIKVTLPDEEPKDDVLASIWARAKIESLMDQDLTGIQQGNPDPAVKEEILGLGLRYQLLTQFTSFVAVEHLRITTGGEPRTVAVPVEMPQGVSHEGVFGPKGQALMYGGIGGGMGGGMGGFGGGYAPVQRKLSAGKIFNFSRTAGPTPAGSESSDRAEKEESLSPVQSKLAPELRELIDKLDANASRHSFTVGKIEVIDGRVEVRLQLASLSDEIIVRLKRLGFKELARAKSVKLLIGTIDVAKLEDLAKLEAVSRIDPSF